MKGFVLTALTVLAFASILFAGAANTGRVPAASSDIDIMDEIRRMDVTKLRKSILACPLGIAGTSCPEDTPFYYFKCCGELNSSCCFRLQDWVLAVIGVMIILVILSIVVNLLRSIFYGR